QLVKRVPELRHHVEMTGRQRALQSFLYQFSNFGRLPAPALRSMMEKLTPMTCEKGGLIIKEGDPAGPMFILEKGRARAFLANNGKERNLAFYRDGDYFGELSILNGSPRAASVEAFTECRLLALEPKTDPPFRAHSTDRRDGLRRGESGNDLPALRAKGQPGAHSSALSHRHRWHQPEGVVSRSHRARSRCPCAKSFVAESSKSSFAFNHSLGRQPLDGALRCR